MDKGRGPGVRGATPVAVSGIKSPQDDWACVDPEADLVQERIESSWLRLWADIRANDVPSIFPAENKMNAHCPVKYCHTTATH